MLKKSSKKIESKWPSCIIRMSAIFQNGIFHSKELLSVDCLHFSLTFVLNSHKKKQHIYYNKKWYGFPVSLMKVQQLSSTSRSGLDKNVRTKQLAKLFRAQRNVYISGFAILLWMWGFVFFPVKYGECWKIICFSYIT